jgi:hypothetical protein
MRVSGVRLLAGAAFLVVASMGLGAGAAGQQAPTKPVPINQLDASVFAQLPTVAQPSLSPNGKRIATKLAVGGVQYLAIVTGAEQPVFVGLGENELNWWHWVNDDWLLIGIGQAQDVQGTTFYVTRAVAVRADAKKMNMLAKVTAGQNGDDVIWYARDGSPRVLMSYQTSIFSNEPGFWAQVDEFDVSTGHHRQVVGPREGVMSWYADGAGTVRMGIGHSDNGRATRVLYRKPGEVGFKTIDKTRGRDDSVTKPALFLRDPDQALMFDDDEDGFTSLYELDLRTLQRGKQVAASKGFDLEGIETGDSGFELAGVRLAEDSTSIRWQDEGMRKLEAGAQALVKNGRVQLVSVSEDRSRAITWVGAADAPGLYMI